MRDVLKHLVAYVLAHWRSSAPPRKTLRELSSELDISQSDLDRYLKRMTRQGQRKKAPAEAGAQFK